MRSIGSRSIASATRRRTGSIDAVRRGSRFLRRTREGPIRLELRLYLSNLDAKLVDVRKHAEYQRPDDYAPGQRLGRELRMAGKDGVLYRSVRHEGGLCAAVFRPRVLGACRQASHYAFHFDGANVVAIDELSTVWTAQPASERAAHAGTRASRPK